LKLSKEYIEELELLHSKKSFGTQQSIPKEVNDILQKNKVSSFLDYGCGKGLLSESVKNQYPDINLYSYDPVTSPIDIPNSVEFTYSSDVLEHVEPDFIDETLDKLFAITTKYQYHLIACHPAKKFLSDGRNAHLIIENPKWWKRKIENYGWKILHEDINEYNAQPKKGPSIHVVKYIVLLEKR
jgi:hypothetical protein